MPVEQRCYRTFLTENQAVVDRVVRAVACRHRLPAEEAEELRSATYLKLIERDYSVLRQYAGRSSLTTYLTKVVTRLHLDRRASNWGRWRPSASAKRLGPTAVRLEALIVRDGIPFGQACEMLRTNFGVHDTPENLEHLRTQLPRRLRRHLVSLEELAEVPAAEPVPPDDRYERLEHSLAALARSDREVLRLVYGENRKVSDVARMHHVDARALYRRLDKLRRRLRSSMAWPASATA